MDRLKKRNPLYLWFTHRKNNRVMDVSLESSDNINEGNDPNEPSISCDRTRTARERNKNALIAFSVSSSQNVNNSSDQNELTSVTTEEVISESITLSELTAVSSDGLSNADTARSELTAVSSERLFNTGTARSELTAVSSERLFNTGTARSELTAVSSEGLSKADTAQSELTAVSSEGLSKADTARSELTAVSSERLFNTGTASSEWTIGTHYGNLSYDSHLIEEVTCVRSLNESIMEQLSKLDDGEDIDLNSYDLKMKRLVYLIVSSVTYRLFGMLLVFVDVSLIITALLVTDNTTRIPLAYHLISLSIALFFLMDVLLQIFVERIQLYFSDMLNFLDAFIIVVTLLVNIIYIFYDFGFLKDIPRLTILFRLIILIRIFHLAYQKRRLEKLTRRMVSGNKRRYKKGGFDLDLTYVTERIIAMSFPSSGKQSLYRNPIKEVVRFLDTKHQNHYQVYNLCSERSYDPKYFHHRVHRIMIDDHNVPSLSEMLEFSKEVNKWMAQDDENIVAIHCKGGKDERTSTMFAVVHIHSHKDMNLQKFFGMEKYQSYKYPEMSSKTEMLAVYTTESQVINGRTGTMVCVCLIVSEIFKTAEDSLYYFGERRTDKTSSTKFQGVETPSQNRYVGYFADVKNLYNLTLPPRKILTIKKIIIYSIHGVGKGNGSDLKVRIIIKRKVIFSGSTSKNCRIVHDIEADRVIIYLVDCPLLHDDVKIQFFSPDLRKFYDNCPFFFWFNTSFIQNNRLYLPRNELDNPHKPKAWKIYRPEFAVELYFEEVIL